jgi:hypothetical protein
MVGRKKAQSARIVGDALLGVWCFGWSVMFAMASAMRHVSVFSSSAIKEHSKLLKYLLRGHADCCN